MHFMARILMLVGLVLSLPAHAEWEYEFQPEPQILPVAQEITKEINKLPEPLFMSDQDKRKVNQLLNAVMSEQRKQTLIFDQHLKTFRESGEDKEWFETQSSYLTVNSLGQSKERLLELTDPITHDKLTGFGPYGVTQFKQEWRQTQLNVE